MEIELEEGVRMSFRRSRRVAVLVGLITFVMAVPAQASDTLCLLVQGWPTC